MVEFVLTAASIALLTGGQLLQKRAVSLAGKPSSWTRYLATVARMRQTWWGIGCVGVGSVTWLGVLYRVDVGKAYPLLSLGVVTVVVLSRLVLREPVPAMRWLGVAMIVAGAGVLGWSGRRIRLGPVAVLGSIVL